MVTYLANGRDSNTFDTAGTTMLPLTLIRGQGFYLDRFAPMLIRMPDGTPYSYVTVTRDHILSRYPVAPALIVTPLVAAQVALLDWLRPGWDRRGTRRTFNECKLMVKRSMAVLMALAGVMLHRLLIGLGLSRMAVPSVLACAPSDQISGWLAAWHSGSTDPRPFA